MAEKKKKVEDVFSSHEERHQYATQLLGAQQHHFHGAFYHAVDKHLIGKNGLPDFDLLNDKKYADKFAQEIIDYSANKIKEHHGHTAKDDFHKAMLMETYTGTTPEELRTLVKRYGSEMDYEFMPRLAGEFSGRIKERLYKITGENLKDEHIGEITKKVGLEGKLEQPLTIEEAREALNTWIENEYSLPKEFIQRRLLAKLKRKRKGG